MPYYRILIWTKKRKMPYTGIRLIGNDNINMVYHDIHAKAHLQYRQELVDIEVQMLSKLCTAVKKYISKPE
jgi:hypothetical protein